MTVLMVTNSTVVISSEVTMKKSLDVISDICFRSVEIARLSFQDLSAELSQRPSAQAVK